MSYECPVCHRPLMGPNEACSGSFTDQDHPTNVAAVPTGKQPPAEPQDRWPDEGLKHPPPENQETVRLSPAEPQGDVVEKAVGIIGGLAWGREWRLLDSAPEVITREREEKARAVFRQLTPLLALEVKERLEGLPRHDCFLDDAGEIAASMERSPDGPWLDRDEVIAALDTPAPSEPEEGK